MESKGKLKETDIKTCMCYYFDDMTDRDIDLSDILLNDYIMKTTKIF